MDLLPWIVLGALALPVLWTWGFVLWMHGRWWQYMRHRGEALPERGLGAWLRVWHREVVALLQVQLWHTGVLFSNRPIAPDGPESGPPVLCVHGFTQNGTNFLRLRRRLRARGRLTDAISMGYPPRQLDRYVGALEGRVERLLAGRDDELAVVAHSMGGLVLRLMLVRRPDLAARISHAVTIASPHEGTAAARGLSLLPETTFMSRHSAELRALPTLAELLPHARVTTLGSTDDTTVYPEETTRLDGTRHVTLHGMGHAGVLVWDEALDAVEEGLETLPADSSAA